MTVTLTQGSFNNFSTFNVKSMLQQTGKVKHPKRINNK